MGLILPQTVKVRTSSIMCKYYREKGYEFEKCGDIIEVNVLDLPKASNVKVKVVCDICGCESEVLYYYVNENISNGTLITCGSNSCKHKKSEDTCIKKYGVKNVAQSQEVQNKIKDTNLKRYGYESAMQNKEIQNKREETNLERYGYKCPLQSQEIQNKSKATNLERYGYKYPLQSQEIQNKSKATNLERYGVENAAQSEIIKNKMKDTCKEKYGAENAAKNEIIKNKIKDTCKERYGVEYAMQNEEIKNKALDSFQFNHTGPSSRAQRYINYILNGNLNKRICGSLVDIYIEKENIIIEHDGSGHFLNDIINGNAFPTKDSLLREKEREDKIINNGYKMIRFIAAKDRIPSDEVILNLIEEFKNSDFKVIRIDFEEGTIEKDYNKKTIYDFGELRRITQKDLEEIESKKQ